MSDDHSLRAHIDPVHRDIPPVHTEDVWHFEFPELPEVGTPVLPPAALSPDEYLLALAALDDGWEQAPGDAELPPAVRDKVETIAVEQGSTMGEYWVKYRPVTDPFADGDGYEVFVVPARIIRGDADLTVERDLGRDISQAMVDAAAQFVARSDALAAAIADIGNAAAAVGEQLTAAWEPVSSFMHRVFGHLVYLTDGDPPGPVTDAQSAAAAFVYAESVIVLQRPPKAMRRRAKARYLEVKRHLPREYWRTAPKVPMSRFGAL